MSVSCDIAEVLWFGFASTDVRPIVKAIAANRCRNVIFFKRNLPFDSAGVDLVALRAMNRAIHAASGDPIWTAIDQEGGLVQRIKAPSTIWPPMMSFANWPAPDDIELARQVGAAMGRELRALDFDVDFAPVLDIHTNDQNPIIGNRAFGVNPDDVTQRALAFAQGLAEAGIVACGKHFPGHGDTQADSHLELPRVDATWERLQRVELAPFRAAAAAALPMFMTAHVVFSAISQVPATMEPRLLRAMLRDEWQYDGVVVSDDLDMKALVSYGAGPAAVAAIRAGCDQLLLCQDERNQEEALVALHREAVGDEAFAALLAASASRVRREKRRVLRKSVELESLNWAAHRVLADRLARGKPPTLAAR